MKSAHKLAAGLAVLITLLVAAYFILMSLQTAMSLDQNSLLAITTEEKSGGPSSRPAGASTEASITRLRVNQSRLVELTTTPAPGHTSDKSIVRTLQVKPATGAEQVESTIIKEPAMTVEVVEGSSKAPHILESPSPSASSEATQSTPGAPISQATESIGASETPISLTTAETASSTTTTTTTMTPTAASTTTTQTTPIPLEASTAQTSEAPSSPASSESTSNEPASSEQTATSITTPTMTTRSTPPPTPTDSERLYKETTAMPADGFQMAPEEEHAWQEFKRQFGRVYQSGEDERQRAEKFVGNLRFINAHNRMADVAFKLGVNQFADLSADEINSRHIGPLINWTSTLDASGATKPPQLRILDEDQSAGEAALSADWRNSTSRPALDQGLCPESALFAVISSLEASLELAGFKNIRLSPRQLMDCLAYSAPPPPAWPPVCSGQLSMVTLWEFLQRQSIRLVPEMEYEGFRQAQMAGQAPPQTCMPPLPEGVRDTRPKVVSYHQVPGEHFEVALQNRGPLVVAIDASRPTFHFYKSGFYHESHCSSDAYNLHALLLASKPGAGETPAHLTLRASLGTSWGESGHMNLLKDPARNKCLPEQLATYPDLGFE